MNPIAVRSLSVRYGSRTALEKVTLDVAPGAVYVLLGPHGAGKSSLVRCLLGRQKPTSGTCFLFGEDARRRRTQAMASLGAVPPPSDTLLSTAARALASFFAGRRPARGGSSVEDRLRHFHVPRDVPFGRLSKGEQGVVQLARALTAKPELLLLDDPTLGPDATARREILAELAGEMAGRGATIFLTLQDVSAVEGLATHVGLLKGGRLLLDDDVNRLKTRFRRIRYSNEVTEERTQYGTELDEFDAVRVKVRGWGIEALVSDFDEEKFARFCAIDGVIDPEASPIPLEEILTAVGGPTS